MQKSVQSTSNLENLVNMYGFHVSTMKRRKTPSKSVWFSCFYNEKIENLVHIYDFHYFALKNNENHAYLQSFLSFFIVET